MDYRDDDALGLIFPSYLVWFGYPLTFVYTQTFRLWHHYTYIHHVKAWLIMSLPILSPYITLSHSFDQRRMWTNLEFSGRVFACLWTLGLASSIMARLIRLLMYLWWCFHVDNRHIMSYFACILDLEFLIDISFVHHFGLALLAQFSRYMVLFGLFMIDASYFHYMIIEHILECLTFWHSISHGEHHCILGHTPIFEFIKFFFDFLTTWSISCFLRVVILGHTSLLVLFY